jgi:PAS domain-containing protein
MREAIAAGKPFHGTILNYCKGGTPFWNELTISPVFDDGGELINFVGLQADVSARIRAAEAGRGNERRLQAISITPLPSFS